MPGFDFSQVLQDAQETLQGNSGTDYKYGLVYPGIGTLTVKLLFNSKSNTVKRIINRHHIGEAKLACMRTYGQECPICKMIENIKNARGIDLGKLGSKARGISIVQYVKSTYKIEKVNPGDIILLMYPWTVYKDMSTVVSQATNQADLEKMMAANEGYCIDITRGADNKYSTSLNPFSIYKSAATDVDFMNLMNSIDSLNEMVLPATPTAEMLKEIDDCVRELNEQYLMPKPPQFVSTGMQTPVGLNNIPFGAPQQPQVPQYQPPQVAYPQQPAVPMAPQVGPQVQAPQVPQYQQPMTAQPPVAPQMAPQAPIAPQAPMAPQMPQQPNQAAAKPVCYGNHGKIDMNTCLLCPYEVMCTQDSPK